MSDAETPPRDYRDTVFLPKTDFPMKAGLPAKEPGIAARWEAEGLYNQVREARRGRQKFIFHDGPPYANGDMHIGHALNHVLKDMVVRTQTLLGKDAPYVPGWDCHGLPIEWKVEEQYRARKRNKDEVDPLEFRDECRTYAQHWVDRQRDQLKRLGINADWDRPYLTMQPESEAAIVAEFLKFAESGQLYRGAKPVMWSPVEKTALAEAEVEYEDVVSTQIDVAFEIVESPIPELVGAHAVIWTTTPWTIPVNQAIAYGPEVEYRLFQPIIELLGPGVDGHEQSMVLRRLQECGAIPRFFLARDNFQTGHWNEELIRRISLVDISDFGERYITPYIVPHGEPIKGSDLVGTIARHPMHHLGGFFAEPRPFLPGEFVTTDTGTGLVHMSPDHGEDDFELCKAHGLTPKFAVEGDGKYREDWGWLGGQGSVINQKFNAPDGPICTDLHEAGALLAASADYKHSYPHSWRSKAKVIYRCTPQWFVPMDKPLKPSPLQGRGLGVGNVIANAAKSDSPLPPTPSPEGEGEMTLRQIALAEIARVKFFPEKGRNRLGSMVEGRPDWVLSRQRAWGVPITLFVHRASGEYLVDAEVNERIVSAIREHGIDAWTPDTAHRFLGEGYDPAEWEPVPDILDVWFDSGTSHAFVLDSGRWPELRWPADLYLEGSDQHRGWFQSSLLESCATRGRAPYDQVLTHGFTMDAKGMKMSKSLGNTTDPLKVMETYGADIIRLWALSVDFTEDHRIGDEILKGVADQYRKLRNTFRYLLGALDGFDEGERLPVEELPELERYVLALLGEVDATLRKSADEYDFNTYVRTLVDFCNEDLSAFYFDIRKDSLYCDAQFDGVFGDPRRRACRTVFDTLFHTLIRWAAPVLVFTAEEVWGTRFPQGGSVHLLEWPETSATRPRVRGDDDEWVGVRALRDRVLEAIEPLRRDKVVRSGLEAEVVVPAAAVPEGFSDADLAELFITATVRRGEGEAVTVTRTIDGKCGRCWRLLPEVPEDGALCGRCESVVA